MRRSRQLLWALFISVACVIAIDSFTNRLDITKYGWDSRFYLKMATEGTHSRQLVAPFAYRFLTPLLAAFLSDAFGFSIPSAFLIIAYTGAVALLLSIYVLCREFRFPFRTTVILMLMTAFSFFHVKFLLFDVYRPDHLALPLLAAGFLALIRGNLFWCTVLSVIGLQIREFLILPPAIFLCQSIRDLEKNPDQKQLWMRVIGVSIPVAAAVLVPRFFIPVSLSIQKIDPIHDTSTLMGLLSPLFDYKRHLNFLFCLLGYALPVILLSTRARWRRAWESFGNLQRTAVLYTVITLILSFYGGSDMARFMPYLFVPQVLLIGFLLQRRVEWVEVIYVLMAMLIFNRIPFPIPIWNLERYLDFYGGWDSRVNDSSWLRFVELGVYIVPAILLRRRLTGSIRPTQSR